MKAQSDSLPTLCWTLVSTSARLCQSLGYHREASVSLSSSAVSSAKRHVFWMLYMIDKIMSLNLGRASSFPDYDIDVEVFEPSTDERFRAWDEVLIGFIGLCKLQGRMYDELYSARARRKSESVRRGVVDERAKSLDDWHRELKSVSLQIPLMPSSPRNETYH